MNSISAFGQPNKLTVIFGHKISRYHAGKLQTEIEDLNLPNPVIRSHYKNGFIKQWQACHCLINGKDAIMRRRTIQIRNTAFSGEVSLS